MVASALSQSACRRSFSGGTSYGVGARLAGFDGPAEVTVKPFINKTTINAND